MQQFIATGHLGQDPDMKYLPNGDAVASFSLAISKRWTTPAGEKKESTLWVRVTTWRALAENCAKFLKKGSKAFISGELAPVNVYTKKDGTSAASYEVTANSVEFLDSKPQDDAGQGQPATRTPVSRPVMREEEIPF